MPDLKSELKKLEALRFDDDGGAPQEVTMQEPAAGISATFFNIIRDNPGSHRNTLFNLAENAGVGKSTSSSLITQFVKRGLVRAVESFNGLTYFTTSQQYTKGYVKREKKAARVSAPKAVAPTVAPSDTSVQDMLNNLSIVKARALYDELKKIFGA